MNPIYAYARAALVKMAEQNVDPAAFVQAADQTKDPLALKVANALLELEKASPQEINQAIANARARQGQQ